MRKIKELYSRLIKVKLSNQIIFVIAVICLMQIIGTFLMYIYFYNIRKDEIIGNNMQMLHQANSNYFSGIVEELSAASRDVFVDEVFWENSGQSSGTEDNQIYNILAGQYQTGNNIFQVLLINCILWMKHHLMKYQLLQRQGVHCIFWMIRNFGLCRGL